MVNYRVIIL